LDLTLPLSLCPRYLPYVGMVTIVMNDYPYVKWALIGVLALFVITSKD
jgi:signal peptidase I